MPGFWGLRLLEWLPPFLCPLGAAEAYLRGDMLLFAVYLVASSASALLMVQRFDLLASKASRLRELFGVGRLSVRRDSLLLTVPFLVANGIRSAVVQSILGLAISVGILLFWTLQRLRKPLHIQLLGVGHETTLSLRSDGEPKSVALREVLDVEAKDESFVDLVLDSQNSLNLQNRSARPREIVLRIPTFAFGLDAREFAYELMKRVLEAREK